jgi:hypothetical protein
MRSPCCLGLCPPSSARQRNLRFDDRRDRPFSIGALTKHNSKHPLPPLSDGNRILFALNICLIHRGGPTLSATPKRQRIRPLLGNSGKHVTAIARQRHLYYCVFKSKCFSLLSLFKRNKSSLLRSPYSVSVRVTPLLLLLGNDSINTFPRQRIHTQL